LAALGLVLCGPATAQAQQDDAAPAAADQAETDPQTSPPTLDVTVDVTATLPEVDRLIAAEGQRVGAAEGAQLISADYMKAQQASTLADALRKTTSVQVDEEGGQQGSLVFIRGTTSRCLSVRIVSSTMRTTKSSTTFLEERFCSRWSLNSREIPTGGLEAAQVHHCHRASQSPHPGRQDSWSCGDHGHQSTVDEGATPRAVGRTDRGTRPPRCRCPDHPRPGDHAFQTGGRDIVPIGAVRDARRLSKPEDAL